VLARQGKSHKNSGQEEQKVRCSKNR
jgi:hypothetical protein